MVTLARVVAGSRHGKVVVIEMPPITIRLLFSRVVQVLAR